LSISQFPKREFQAGRFVAVQTLLYILGASFLLCSVLTPLARRLASRYGLVDHPDARRKIHGKPIPVAGGIAVLVSGSVVLGAAFLLPHPYHSRLEHYAGPLLGLLLAALVICALGVLDDFHCLRGRHKLLGQMVAVGIVMAFGVQVRELQVFGWNLELGPLAIPLTLCWLLAAINSLNLIDGMDGLLSSVGIIVSLAMAAMAILTGNWAAACVAVVLAGSLIGFLQYNFPPASIFLGDAGSMLVGLVIGVLGIQASLKGPSTAALAAPVAMLTIPFFDTTAAIIRRKLTGRSIYTTDRGHLHHCLLGRGISVHLALLCVSVFCLLTVLGALASMALQSELLAACTVALTVAILVASRLFGYAEFLLVKKRLGQLVLSFFQKRGEGKVRQIEIHLQGNGGWKGLMDAVTASAFELNLQTVRLDVSAPAFHEEYHAQWDRFEEELDGATLWRAEIPLSLQGRGIGRLMVTGYQDSEPLWAKIAAVTAVMEQFENAVPPQPAVRNGSAPLPLDVRPVPVRQTS
jgi:UDP-GlcNAc:undecaprenyl-phosphate GlcNAc-1-phosphate transferase